jgi:hypothetical protein
MSFAIGGFADLWLYSGSEHKALPRSRDMRAGVVANYACDECGAQRGEPCSRSTVARRTVLRGLPHFGRGKGAPPRYGPRDEPNNAAKRGTAL